MIFHSSHRASTLFEVVIAMGIFLIGIVTTIVIVFDAGDYSQQSVFRTQALALAQEGLEATHSMRDRDFTLLTDGPHGLSMSSNQWTFSGTSDTQGVFTRTVTVASSTVATSSASSTKAITSNVSWTAGKRRNNSVTLTEEISNWRRQPTLEIDCFRVDLSQASIEQGSVNKIVRYIFIHNPVWCPRTINLDKAIVTWGKSSAAFQKFRINNRFLWQGSTVTGNIMDLNPDQTLLPGGTPMEIDQLRWGTSIAGTDIGITFIMKDGSQESFTIPAFPEQ